MAAKRSYVISNAILVSQKFLNTASYNLINLRYKIHSILTVLRSLTIIDEHVAYRYT